MLDRLTHLGVSDVGIFLWWKSIHDKICHSNYKCTIKWHLVQSHCCTTVTTVCLQNFFMFPDRNSLPSNSMPAPDNHHLLCVYEFMRLIMRLNIFRVIMRLNISRIPQHLFLCGWLTFSTVFSMSNFSSFSLNNILLLYVCITFCVFVHSSVGT